MAPQNHPRVNVWLFSYGSCSFVVGAYFLLLALRVPGPTQIFVGLFGAYMMFSGIAISLHHRHAHVLFLISGLVLLSWSIKGILSVGFARHETFSLLGSLIAIHGYWVLKDELEKYHRR